MAQALDSQAAESARKIAELEEELKHANAAKAAEGLQREAAQQEADQGAKNRETGAETNQAPKTKDSHEEEAKGGGGAGTKAKGSGTGTKAKACAIS